jgi:hypothetical protein
MNMSAAAIDGSVNLRADALKKPHTPSPPPDGRDQLQRRARLAFAPLLRCLHCTKRSILDLHRATVYASTITRVTHTLAHKTIL